MNNKFNNNDFIKRFVEKNLEQKEYSPFNPPEVYAPPNIERIPKEEFHPFLIELINEHETFSSVLKNFENYLFEWRKNNWSFNQEINNNFKQFFYFFDGKVQIHNQKEEKKLFPLLHKKLIEIGEHNSIDTSYTSIKLMEDEHIKIIQAVAVTFNFLGLSSLISNTNSRIIIYEKIFEQGIAIVESMKLHIFREENILFPLAMKLFNEKDFMVLTLSHDQIDIR